jgi:hypothetical protein
LFLLLDSEERVLADLGGGVPDVIGILDGDEVLVGGSDLCNQLC